MQVRLPQVRQKLVTQVAKPLDRNQVQHDYDRVRLPKPQLKLVKSLAQNVGCPLPVARRVPLQVQPLERAAVKPAPYLAARPKPLLLKHVGVKAVRRVVKRALKQPKRRPPRQRLPLLEVRHNKLVRTVATVV